MRRSSLRCIAPAKLPVITRLAREFAVCDRWFSSVPGPTWPNRFFAHCATSKGFIDNSPFHNYDTPTIFERLADKGFTWNVYFHDVAQSTFHKHLARDENVVDFLAYRDFARNARKGMVANYSFIEPRYFNGVKRANDQHPPPRHVAG
jgi:phospholipase C